MFSLLPSTTCIAISRETNMLNTFPKGSQYAIKYRILNAVKWKTFDVSFDEINTEIVGLKSNTVYDIRVYLQNTDGDVKKIFEASCKTKESCARYLKENAFIIRERTPQIYHLKPYDIKGICNDIWQGVPIMYWEKTYHPKSGSMPVPKYEKTLLILGETWTGKSTFINALINYVADVSYGDTHRFALIDPNEKNTGRQCQSETSSVTMYRLPKFESSKVDSELNIIDTPGFTDTKLDINKGITTCLHNMFNKTRTGHLDAVLLFMPTPTSRLTSKQKHIFSSILKMFGMDMVDNIFVILTFYDGGDTEPCIKLLKQVGVPCKYVYRFNNQNVLNEFGSNCSRTTSYNESIWNSRTKSFNDLFQDLNNVPKKSLSSTVKVNYLQTNLQNQLSNLDEQIAELSQNMFNHKNSDLKIADGDKSFSRCQQTLVKSQQLINELQRIALDIESICNMQVYIKDLIDKAKERGSEGVEKFKVLLLEQLLHNF